MSFNRIVEAIVQEAMELGKFDHLPGKGKPIDLTEYFEALEEVRLVNSVLKNAGNREANPAKTPGIQPFDRTTKTSAPAEVRLTAAGHVLGRTGIDPYSPNVL